MHSKGSVNHGERFSPERGQIWRKMTASKETRREFSQGTWHMKLSFEAAWINRDGQCCGGTWLFFFFLVEVIITHKCTWKQWTCVNDRKGERRRTAQGCRRTAKWGKTTGIGTERHKSGQGHWFLEQREIRQIERRHRETDSQDAD